MAERVFDLLLLFAMRRGDTLDVLEEVNKDVCDSDEELVLVPVRRRVVRLGARVSVSVIVQRRDLKGCCAVLEGGSK